MAKLASATALLEQRAVQNKELEVAGCPLPRGAISEVVGPASAGRTGFLHAALARATQRGEACAVIDWSGCFDPASAEANGVLLTNLLWVRANRRLDHSMTAADWLLHAGGFGIVALDLCDAPIEELRRIPLSWWHRFRLTIQNTPAILLIVADRPVAGSCPAASLTVERARTIWSGSRHLPCLAGFEIRLESRKPIGPGKSFAANWVGVA